MKFTILTVSAVLCSAATAKFTGDVSSILNGFYPTATLNLPASKSTALASALESQQSTWLDSSVQTSVNAAIYSAAPSSVVSSISSSGYTYADIVTQTWFTEKVPKALQTAVQNQISAFDSVAASVIGTSTSKAGAVAARATEAAVAGVVGVVGVVMAVL